MRDTLYIVMPAYNEEENIRSVIAQWYPLVEKIGNDSRLVIVDDGSKDKTYEIMVELKEKYPFLIPLTKKNSGHGTTCLFAYNYALDSGAEWIFQTDSDGQTDPSEFWLLWEKRSAFSFLIGSRDNRMDGKGRVFVTKVLKFVVWSIFGTAITDANTPFRLMKADLLAGFLKKIPADAFLSNVMISILAVKNNKKNCIWVPITFKPRQGGVNSINFKRIMGIGVKAFHDFRAFKKEI